MRTTRGQLVTGLAAWLALAAIGPPAQAGIILNAEPNDTFGTAQVIPSASFTLDFVSTIGSGGGSGFVNTSTAMPHVQSAHPEDDVFRDVGRRDAVLLEFHREAAASLRHIANLRRISEHLAQRNVRADRRSACAALFHPAD